MHAFTKARTKTSTARLPVPLSLRIAMLDELRHHEAVKNVQDAFVLEDKVYRWVINNTTESAPAMGGRNGEADRDLLYVLELTKRLFDRSAACSGTTEHENEPTTECSIDVGGAMASMDDEKEHVHEAFACPKCRSTDVEVQFKQLRSIDEPSTICITCKRCGRTSQRN